MAAVTRVRPQSNFESRTLRSYGHNNVHGRYAVCFRYFSIYNIRARVRVCVCVCAGTYNERPEKNEKTNYTPTGSILVRENRTYIMGVRI